MMTLDEFLGAISAELNATWGPEDPDNPGSDYEPIYLMVPLDAVISILYGPHELDRVDIRLDLLLSSIAEMED